MMDMEGQVGQFDFLVGMEYGQAGEIGVSAATGRFRVFKGC
jgi:hypothetical protein